MNAQEMNDYTYEETEELNRNPEIVCRDSDGNEYRIADWVVADGQVEFVDPLVLLIERVE